MRDAAPLSLRRARLDDAEAIANVYLRSRQELVACAPLAQSDESIRQWVRQRLIPSGEITVAVVRDQIAFYERRGFKAIQFSDGSGNEENCPDVLYEWTTL